MRNVAIAPIGVRDVRYKRPGDTLFRLRGRTFRDDDYDYLSLHLSCDDDLRAISATLLRKYRTDPDPGRVW